MSVYHTDVAILLIISLFLREMKGATHTFMMVLLRDRMSRIPQREGNISMHISDIKAHVLMACRSRLALTNMFFATYKKCSATGPVVWPR